MKVAILVDCNGTVCADAECGLRFFVEIDDLSAVFGLNVDEGNVVFGCHRVGYASDFDLDSAIVNSCYYRYMLFGGCINCVCFKFCHLFATAYNRNFMVNNFYYNVATMITFEKFYCNDSFVFGLYYYNISRPINVQKKPETKNVFGLDKLL